MSHLKRDALAYLRHCRVPGSSAPRAKFWWFADCIQYDNQLSFKKSTPDSFRKEFTPRRFFYLAHSTAKCNGQSFGVEENLTRSSIAKYLSGARVEFILDLLDIGI